MSQGNQSVANGTGAQVRAGMNVEFGALYSISSGPTAPATTIAYQFWADTTAGLLKQRNAANTAWLSRGALTAGEWLNLLGKNSIEVDAGAYQLVGDVPSGESLVYGLNNAGVRGMHTIPISFATTWVFDNATGAADPGLGKFRLNAATLALTTEIYVSQEAEGGIDIATLLAKIGADEEVLVYQGSDRDRGALYTVSAAGTDNGAWWTFPVIFRDDGSGGELQDGKSCVFNFVGLGGGGGVTSFKGRVGAVLPQAGDYDGIALNLADQLLTRALIKDFSLERKIATVHTGSVTISHVDGNVYVDTGVTGNLTLDVSNWPAGYGKVDVWLKSDATGGWTVTFTGFTNSGDAPAALTASKWSRYILETPNGGTDKFVSPVWQGK